MQVRELSHYMNMNMYTTKPHRCNLIARSSPSFAVWYVWVGRWVGRWWGGGAFVLRGDWVN